MVNQLTGDWRRPWIASHGSLHQPAWPVQLSETHAHPPAIPEGKRTAGPPGLARTGDPAAPSRQHTTVLTPPAGSSPRLHTALGSTEHRCPRPPTPRVPPPHHWAGGLLHIPASDRYLKYPGSPPFLPPLSATAARTGVAGEVPDFSASSCLPLARGHAPCPGRTCTLETSLFLSRSCQGHGDCCPLPPGVPRT